MASRHGKSKQPSFKNDSINKQKGRPKHRGRNYQGNRSKNVNEIAHNNQGGGKEGGNDNEDNVMDDIVAQLRRQRQKQQQNQERCSEENSAGAAPLVGSSNNDGPSFLSAATPSTLPDVREDVHLSSKKRETCQKKENKNHSRVKNKQSNVHGAVQTVGNFAYDPILKRYFPISMLKPNGNNDVCIQNVQKRNKSSDRKVDTGKHEYLKGQQHFYQLNAISDSEIRRINFRGTTLRQMFAPSAAGLYAKSPTGRKRKKQSNNTLSYQQSGSHPKFHGGNQHLLGHSSASFIPCSGRTVHMLVSSLSYCTNPLRRQEIASFLGPLSLGQSAMVVPTVLNHDMIIEKHDRYTTEPSHPRESSNGKCGEKLHKYDQSFQTKLNPLNGADVGKQHQTGDHISRKNMKNKRGWFSMLPPIKPSQHLQRNDLTSNQTVPYDCQCKSYLHPTAPTFDIRPHSFSAASMSSALHSDNNLPHVVTIADDQVYYRQSVHIPSCGRNAFWSDEYAPLEQSPKKIGNAGCRHKKKMAYKLEGHLGNEMYQGVRFAPFPDEKCVVGIITQKKDSSEEGYFHMHNGSLNRAQTIKLSAPATDFCFPPNATFTDPGVAAFIHGEESSFHDISTGYATCVYSNWLDSDFLCVQYLKNVSQGLLYGHRDGSISLFDTRSGNATFGVNTQVRDDSFGSATTLRTMQDNNLILVKGSFGSCRAIDLRRLRNNRMSSPERFSPTVLEFTVPDRLIHTTKSVRCAGVAMDPNEKIVVAPFAGRDDELFFGMWCCTTGSFLRSVNVGNARMQNSEVVGFDGGPIFCELSGVATAGFEMSFEEGSKPTISNNGSWGLWFKSGIYSGMSPPACGSIHHIVFEN